MYLIDELRVGFDQKMDFGVIMVRSFWEKDNPIDYAVILKIKELWHSGSSILKFYLIFIMLI